MQAQKDITFGEFRLDFANECLWQGQRSIALRPKAFAVLKLLIQNPGQLVSKQQVLDSVWPNTFVGDAVLKDNIRQLREALNDDAVCPTYIETAHRRGYRFIGQRTAPTPIAAERKSFSELASDSVALTPSNPILGRETDLAKMRSWLQRALAGERQTVFVTGEAGIGKTTIVNAFLEKASVAGLLVARGQCLEHYGSAEAYLPVLDAFSRLCRSAGGDQVIALLRQQAPTWLAQMSSLLPPSERAALQSQVVGVTRERMMRELADAIEALTSESPLLLVLEDLHWSDYSTLDLVSYLARCQNSARLMVIGTYRPVDVILGDHPIKGVKRELHAHGLCHEVALEYLSEAAIGEYLTARFPVHQFSPRVARSIHQRTEGNPLFLVNLVEYLIDQKAIVKDPSGWKLGVELSEVEKGVPTNLRQLIEKQVERLSADERAVLEGASVAGVECSAVAIAAGLDNTVEWVEEHCEELARRHQFLSPAWLVELPDGTITPRHRFTHVLYRDVPYRLIPAMRRAQIHQRIAERGIAIYGDRRNEIAAELAMHFEQSRDWPRAFEYLLHASENAATHSAHHEAIDLANRGLEALSFLPEAAEHAKSEMKLRMILIASLMAVKGFASPSVEKVNARGRELFWRHGPSPELFYMLWSLNMYQQFSGQMHSSLEISYQLMQLAEDLKDGALAMEAHRSIGAVLSLLGRYSDALDHLEKGEVLCRLHHDRRNSVFVNFDSKVMFECFAALTLWPLGYSDQSARRLAAGLAFARELGHAQTLVVALHIAAQLHQLRGEAPPVLAYAKEALELADEYGFEIWRVYGLIELGWAEAELGNSELGIEKMRRGLAEYEGMGATLRSPYFLALVADQLGKAGRAKEAIASIHKCLAVAQQTGEGYALPEWHRIKGELLLNSSDLAQPGGLTKNSSPSADALSEARVSFTQALTFAKQQRSKSLELRAALSMCRLERMLGGSDHTQLAEAYSFFTEGFETQDLKEAKSILSGMKMPATAK
jgi:DNA-binding winged helix-turn-helix (wHTH) protein/tetratricopeptide (TPR) repeat protein